LVDQQEEGLIGVQLHTASIGKWRDHKKDDEINAALHKKM
jgi:hypothetical protein